MADPRVKLVALLGVGVALALGVSIPREESGRRVEATVDQAGALQVRHISGRQYLRVYLDLAGVTTACDGITSWRGRPLPRNHTFNEAQCGEMLAEQLLAHAEDVMACTPGLALSPVPAAELRREGPRFAAVSLTYNIGGRRWCSSTARRRFNAGDFPGGCTAITWWNKVGRTVVPGLVNRRTREELVCREGLATFRRAYP